MSQFKMIFKTIAILLIPVAAFAHPGHFENAPIAHALWHSVVALLTVNAIGVAAFTKVRRLFARSTERRNRIAQ